MMWRSSAQSQDKCRPKDLSFLKLFHERIKLVVTEHTGADEGRKRGRNDLVIPGQAEKKICCFKRAWNMTGVACHGRQYQSRRCEGVKYILLNIRLDESDRHAGIVLIRCERELLFQPLKFPFVIKWKKKKKNFPNWKILRSWQIRWLEKCLGVEKNR